MTDAAPRRANYAGLIVPFALLGAVLLAWTVWWFVVANRIEQGADRTAADLRAAGWQVNWRERGVSGWPFRTYLRFRDVRAVAPSGQGIEAPELGAEATTYALGKWVIAAPRGLTLLRGPRGPVRVEGEALRASVSGLGRAGPPNVAVQLLKPVFTQSPEAQPFPLAAADKVELYVRPKRGSAGDGEALFRVEGGKGSPGGGLESIGPGAPFSTWWEAGLPRLASARGADWADAVRAWTAAGGALTGVRGRAKAGQAALEATAARLTVGPDGRLRGSMDLSLTRAPDALQALGRSRAVDPAAAAAAAGARGGHTEAARMTLSFDNGETRLGPVRLAPAPKVY
jgi:hypothetical protein